jgi:small subunit ribosomal protein S6
LQRYEVIGIVSVDVNDDDITALIERSQTIINDRKGVIAKVDRWGKRRLAYEIKKQKDGYYFLIDFAGDGSVVTEIERNYKIDDRVIKFMTVKKEGACTREGIEQEIAEAEAKRTQARAGIEPPASGDDKTIQQEKEPGSAPRRISTREDISTKGE